MKEGLPIPHEDGGKDRLTPDEKQPYVFYTRYFNDDDTFEDVKEPGFDPDEDLDALSARLDEPVDPRPAQSVFTDRKGTTYGMIHIGGHGWTIGLGSIAEVLDGEEKGQRYSVDLHYNGPALGMKLSSKEE